jgi:hypothetical protein
MFTKKKQNLRAAEMAHQLRALVALAEDPGSIPTTHIAGQTAWI